MLHLHCHIGAPHLHVFNCHLLAKILWRSITCAFFTLPKRLLFPCTCANKIWCYVKFYWNWKRNTEPCWWKWSIFRSCLPYLNQVTTLAYSFQMEINLCSAPHFLFHSSQKSKGAFWLVFTLLSPSLLQRKTERWDWYKCAYAVQSCISLLYVIKFTGTFVFLNALQFMGLYYIYVHCIIVMYLWSCLFYNRKSVQQFAPKEPITKMLISWLLITQIDQGSAWHKADLLR